VESVYLGLNKLKELLNLRERPRILECFDVAVWQGSSPTAAQIVFNEGKANKKAYKNYHLEVRPEGNNDFEMLKELMARRIQHGDLPDVFIVDGGKGQVSSFLAVLKEFNIETPVVGLAKSKVIPGKGGFRDDFIKKSEERLIIPGRMNPYFLSRKQISF